MSGRNTERARGLQRWLAMSLGVRKHKDAAELVVLASGVTDALWRGTVEQVAEHRPAELVAELEDLAERHADERGGSVRFFARWLDDAGETLVGHSWRQGEGGQLAMDGTAESLVQQMQATLKDVMQRDGERQDAMMAMMNTVMTSLQNEAAMLRQELRDRRIAEDAGHAGDDAGDESASPRRARKGSHLDAAIAELAEYAGRKMIDKHLASGAEQAVDAGADASANQQ